MAQSSLRARPTFVLGLVASTCWFVGCGGGPPTGSVSGKVTQDGVPLTAGLVLFSNEEKGVGAGAELDTSGTYQIESIETGEYQVAVQPPPAPPPHEMEQAAVAPRTNIPKKYQDPKTSGLTATVQEGANSAHFGL
jgi:hypothetical protein